MHNPIIGRCSPPRPPYYDLLITIHMFLGTALSQTRLIWFWTKGNALSSGGPTPDFRHLSLDHAAPK